MALTLKPFFQVPNSSLVPEKKAVHANTKKLGCQYCKLDQFCQSPCMSVYGKGDKKVLVLLDAPGASEDRLCNPYAGMVGGFLKSQLSAKGLDVETDLWTTFVINCRPAKFKRVLKQVSNSLLHNESFDAEFQNRFATDKEIAHCRNIVLKRIKELKPSVILAFGTGAMKSLCQHRGFYKNFPSALLFQGEFIPDYDLNAWVIPLLHPSFVRKEENFMYMKKWHAVLKQVFAYIDKPLPNFSTLQDGVELVFSPTTAVERLEAIYKQLLTEKKPFVVLDYETTGLKPYVDGHKIFCAALSYASDKAISFFTTNETWPILQKILEDIRIKKGAHNIQFEQLWTMVRGNPKKGGFKIQGWYWDSMLAAFILDNRKGRAGLKFLSYVKFGVLGYDNTISEFLEAKTTSEDKKGNHKINNIEQAPKHDLFLYMGLDTILSRKLAIQQIQIIGEDEGLKRANTLWQESALMLVNVEKRGIRVDLEYCQKQIAFLDRKIKYLTERLYNDKYVQHWQKLAKKNNVKFSLNSNPQLARLLFDEMGIESTKKTKGGGNSTDKSVLEDLDYSFIKDLIEIAALEKIKTTYIKGFIREAPDGFLHPTYNLNTVVSYRGSCIAKGSLVMVNRDYDKSRVGVPIEDIKSGDYVFCFDNELKPALRKVLWAGKTGHKEVVRIHYRAGRGKRGYLDTTPEHLIRMSTGEYIQAKDLLKNKHIVGISDKRLNGSLQCSVLSMRRTGKDKDLIYATGGFEFLEHHFVYEQRTGHVIKANEVIHHKNEKHFDHSFFNLDCCLRQSHSRNHSKKFLSNPVNMARNTAHLHNIRKQVTILVGEKHPQSLNLSKLACLRLLVKARGRLTTVDYDFTTIKKYLNKHSIDYLNIALRYNDLGLFLSKGLLQKNLDLYGIHQTKQKLFIGHERLKKLCAFYKIIPHNHIITSIEYLPKKVDVYDLQVDEFSNFIVNEICVHNCTNPNFQNIPIRDAVAQKATRRALYPAKGCMWLAVDYASIEVRIAATYHQDPNMLRYLNDSHSDMHRDMAMQILFLEEDEVSKHVRAASKNGFVFPQFYGDWFKACAENMWRKWFNSPLAVVETTGQHIYDHLKKHRIRNLQHFINHMRDVENHFWQERFPVYKEWRDKNWETYQKKGYMRSHTGFKYTAVMDEKQASNFGTQGAGFHCLLSSMIDIENKGIQQRFKSYLMGQIHDAAEFSLYPQEMNTYLPFVKKIMINDLLKKHTWLNIPMDIEMELAPINKSWYEVSPIIKRQKACKCGAEWGYPKKDGRFICPLCQEFSVKGN